MARGEEYEDFVDKFQPKKTTDDCYTPKGVYDVIAAWVRNRYELGQDVKFVRPFYPGGDFETYDYPSGCAVVDNPPFSIFSKIIRFYLERKIPFFLFADARNVFYYLRFSDCTAVVPGSEIVYENGARIRTSFLTNMSPDIMFESAPDLCKKIEACYTERKKPKKKNIIDLHFVSGIDVVSAARKGLSVCVPKKLSRISTQYIYGHPVIVRGDIAKAIDKAKSNEKQKPVCRYVYLTKETNPEDSASIEELDGSIGVVNPPEMKIVE